MAAITTDQLVTTTAIHQKPRNRVTTHTASRTKKKHLAVEHTIKTAHMHAVMVLRHCIGASQDIGKVWIVIMTELLANSLKYLLIFIVI